MRNPEKAIEKVLAGLRDTEAPLGMESRILAAAVARTGSQLAAAPRWAWPVVLTSAVALLLTAAIIGLHWNTRSLPQPLKQSDAPRSLPPDGSALDGQAPPRRHNQRVRPVSRPAKSLAHSRSTQQTDVDDAVLLSEMRAPSCPAPEEPLTNEEKLLIRTVRIGDPQVMAMLNPESRARQEAESEAEFQEFANQSGNGDSERNLTTR
jgi:hypothetical protein